MNCVTNGNNESETGNPVNKTEIVKTDSVTSDFICPQSEWPYYGIYFTNWSWTLMCISFWLDTTLVCLRYNAERKHVHQANGESKIISDHKSNLQMKRETHKGNLFYYRKPYYLPYLKIKNLIGISYHKYLFATRFQSRSESFMGAYKHCISRCISRHNYLLDFTIQRIDRSEVIQQH